MKLQKAARHVPAKELGPAVFMQVLGGAKVKPARGHRSRRDERNSRHGEYIRIKCCAVYGNNMRARHRAEPTARNVFTLYGLILRAQHTGVLWGGRAQQGVETRGRTRG